MCIRDRTRDELREQTRQEDRACMEKLRDAGMEVYEIPPEDIPKWQEATMPVRENFIRKMGDLGRQLVDQCLAANQLSLIHICTWPIRLR